MSYINGSAISVSADKKEAYHEMAAKVAPVFKRHGAVRIVECWGNDLPDGKRADFKGAVKAEPGGNVVFSSVVRPSKTVRDAAGKKIMEDPVMRPGPDMPFDGRRLIHGGFELLLDVE